MRGRDGEIDDNVDVVARQKIVHAIGGQAVFGGEVPRAIFDDIGASGQLDDRKWRAARDVCRRDIASSD